jgi:hypothetical protein
MATLPKSMRALAAGMVALAVALAVLAFVASRVLERTMRGARQVGEIHLVVHQPSVSPFFRVRADSVVVHSPDFHLTMVRLDARLLTLGALPFRKNGAAAVLLKTDSLALRLDAGKKSDSGPIELPSALKFPFGVAWEWRVLTVSMAGRAGNKTFTMGRAVWHTRGSQAVRGEFSIPPPTPSTPVAKAAPLKAVVNARWRGPTLRYRIEVLQPGGEAHLAVSGIREKRDLRLGYDSIEFFSQHPARILPPPGDWNLAAVSDLKVAAKVDWHQDSLRLKGRFATMRHPPIQEARWDFAVRMGPRGGVFHVTATGNSKSQKNGTRSEVPQTLRLRGGWSHPVAWPAVPALESWRGYFSGEVRGGDWKLLTYTLPLDFEIPEGRLDTGLHVTASVVTRDASKVDLHWNGDQPGRLGFEGEVSPEEAFALVWTDTNVAYRSARIEGVWENARLRATAHIKEPRAYGAFADSLEAVNEVTSSGYFLRAGRIYQNGELFTGAGQVLWKNPAGHHAVSLQFDAGHPTYGKASIVMPHLNRIELKADSVRPVRFPHHLVRRLAPLDPLLQGQLHWDHAAGSGAVALGLRMASDRGILDAHADATWTKDSLRVRHARIASGDALAEGEAVLPFGGRGWAGPWEASRLMGGTWRLRAVGLDPGLLMAIAGRSSGKERGVLDGELFFSPQSGIAGILRADSLRLPPGPGGLGMSSLTVTGVGDSVRVEAAVYCGTRVPWRDTVVAILSNLGDAPRLRAENQGVNGFRGALSGSLPGWRSLEANVTASGRLPLGEASGVLGRIEDVRFDGELYAPLSRAFVRDLVVTGRAFSLRHVSAFDTQFVTGVPSITGGVLRLSEMRLHNAAGSEVTGWMIVDLPEREVQAEVTGKDVKVVLPGGEIFKAQNLSAALTWDPERGLVASTDARSGFLSLPPSSLRVETGFEFLRAKVTYPSGRGTQVPPTLTAKARFHDMLLQRKWGWRDATAYFTGFNRSGGRAPSTAKRTLPWELDIDLEAAGVRNRINTDVLRMNFTGDARITGAYPYTLVRGKVSGLQGEVGQARQAYVLRDFEVKWDNVTLEDGILYAEGEKRLRADCRPETRQTCQIYIRLDGRLEEVGFTYETDCGQNTGESVAPSVLINSMAQGCYVSETSGGEGNYGGAAFAMLEPTLNARLSKEFARGSGGFIKSTQVSGLSALIGSDSSGLEAVALEVESREVHRVGLKGRAGYHPETKLANPMEYRMAAEYRPPLDRLATDSIWRARLRDRFTLEAAVETRPEGRDVEEERRVRQRAGLRYRYRFWDLW